MTPAIFLMALVTIGAVTLTGWVWGLLFFPLKRSGRTILGAGNRAVVSVGLGTILIPLALLLASLLFREPITALPAAITIALLMVIPLPFVWQDVLGAR